MAHIFCLTVKFSTILCHFHGKTGTPAFWLHVKVSTGHGVCSSNCVKVQVKPIFCDISSWYWNSEPWKSNKLLRMSDGTLLEHTIIFRTVLVISHEWFLCFGYVTYFSRLFEVGGDDVIYFHPLIRIWLLMLPAVKTFTHSNLVKQHPHSQNKGIFWVRSAYWLKNYKKK